MEKKGLTLLKLARQFSQEKLLSITPFSRNSLLVSHNNLQEDDADLDDWELIEVLDREFTGDEGDVEILDLMEADDPHSPFFCFKFNHKIKYRIMSKLDVLRLLDEKVSRVSTVLLLSRSEATILLNHFKWRVSKVNEEWLTSEEQVRKVVGLFERPTAEISNKEMLCTLCHESRGADNMVAVSCGHQVCLTCWTGYISDAINEGPECLTLRCPTASCEAAVGIELVELVSTQDDMKKFKDYLSKSYVASRRRKTKLCPAPGCEYVVVFPSTNADRNNDVTCKCLHSFCWNCGKDAHTPIDCGTVDAWLSQMVVQSTNWLLTNAMACPSCEMLIEKVSCIRYARCILCNYAFYNDVFAEDAKDTEDTEDTKVMKVTKQDYKNTSAASYLERFRQYYDGYSCNEAARANALTDLMVLKKIQMELLCNYLALPVSEFQFLVEAHTQVVNSYRILKWMYVYAYYQPEEEFLKRSLLEFMLEQGVAVVRMLENHVNELVQVIIDSEIYFAQFDAFREDLTRLTRVIRNYIERLVESVNNDLSEVVSVSRRSPRESRDVAASCSSSSPTRRVIKTETKEGMSSPVVNMKSEVLIPGATATQKEIVADLKLE